MKPCFGVGSKKEVIPGPEWSFEQEFGRNLTVIHEFGDTEIQRYNYGTHRMAKNAYRHSIAYPVSLTTIRNLNFQSPFQFSLIFSSKLTKAQQNVNSTIPHIIDVMG